MDKVHDKEYDLLVAQFQRSTIILAGEIGNI